ncbi:isoprenylcysteine carboxyl methyltransferase (ICMT) family protein YpbQ [Bradyrhizobium sp. AZCC 1577]|uniref:isoprenylcysteine carboxylmethyltransferase family protein n=1 Tax=Bradyrhizobium sp. AZCC 1577 TaxID=3117019 RepID=UPI002FF2E6E6
MGVRSLFLFITAAVAFRVAMLVVSMRNERALRKDGAVEYGERNSRWLALAHIAFYVAASIEGIARAASFDPITIMRLVLYVFGVGMLLVVSHLLGRLWTVRLMIARNHVLVKHPLFRWVRHLNYYLSILPELVGFALVLHAYFTLVVGLAIYAVPLAIRILQEEKAMRERFPGY